MDFFKNVAATRKFFSNRGERQDANNALGEIVILMFGIGMWRYTGDVSWAIGGAIVMYLWIFGGFYFYWKFGKRIREVGEKQFYEEFKNQFTRLGGG